MRLRRQQGQAQPVQIGKPADIAGIELINTVISGFIADQPNVARVFCRIYAAADREVGEDAGRQVEHPAPPEKRDGVGIGKDNRVRLDVSNVEIADAGKHLCFGAGL